MRLLIALLMTLAMGVAHADNSNPTMNTGYAGAGGLLATIGVGTLISVLNGSAPTVAQRDTFYPTTQALMTVPFGARCELVSTMVNGQFCKGF